jgi:ubiquinone/menaquinone biosynthesis C-methylase UbiE
VTPGYKKPRFKLQSRRNVQVLLPANSSTPINPRTVHPTGKSPASAESPIARPAKCADGAPDIPRYLTDHYWWAYVHPRAVQVFERQWLIAAILWGNYRRLRDAALNALGSALPGRTLQVASAYGDFTPALAERAAKAAGEIDVIDVLPIQLENLKRKLSRDAPVRLTPMDSAALDFANGSFDRAVLFFLLHEQPESWRRRTLAETLRVVRPGGRVVIVEYARPYRWNPLRYVFAPVLAALEPFALDLWRHDIREFLPREAKIGGFAQRRFFGGLYQLVSFQRLD